MAGIKTFSDFIQSKSEVYTFVLDRDFLILESNQGLKGSFFDYLNGEDRHKMSVRITHVDTADLFFFFKAENQIPVPLKSTLWNFENNIYLIAQKCSVEEYYKEDLKSDLFILNLDENANILSSTNPNYEVGHNLLKDYWNENAKILETAFIKSIKSKIITGFELNISSKFNDSTVFRFIPYEENHILRVKFVVKTYNFNNSLSEYDNYFQDIIDSSADFIYKTDYLGNFVFINETAKKRYGFDKESLNKPNFREWIRSDYKPLVENFYANQFKSKTETTYLEFPTVTDGGDEVWVGQNVRLVLSDDWILGIQTTCRDITDNKIIEEELMEIQSKNQAILDSIPDSMFLIDDKLTLLDKKIEESSYFFDIEVGDRILESSMPDVLLKTIEHGIAESFAQEKIVKLELSSDINGTEQIYDLRISPVNQQQCLMLVRNITTAIIQQRKLQKSQEKEREALDAKQRYLSFMTHEIRTPLNAIIGLTDLIFDTSPTPKQMEYLKGIRSSSSLLSKIINDVLDFNKLENNKIKLDEVDFSLATVFKDVLRTCNVYSFNKPLTLSQDLDKNIPAVIRGDANKLIQILTNLISNAIKFTQRGSVVASAKIIESEGNQLALEFGVRDTGIGIPHDKLEKVFNSYEQLDSSISRKFGGTGLGLTISQKFVELMGGKIEIESVPDQGSYFSFKIPFTVSTDALKKEVPNKVVDFSPYHILLVEDNEMNQLVMSKYFHKWGLSFDIAENGEEALKLIEDKEYNLILLDLEMPVMDGFETVENIRNHQNTDINQTIVIALSASVFSEVEERTKRIGFNDFIGKPINASYVYKKLAEYLVKSEGLEEREVHSELDFSKYNSENASYDLSYLIESSFNDTKYVRKMVELFVSKTPDYVQELHALYEDNNFAELKKIAHKFKASIAIMGVQKAEVAIHHLEANITSRENMYDLPMLLQTIKESCTKACEELKQKIEANSLF